MSGIYGLFSNIISKDYIGTCINRAAKWNLAYGSNGHEEHLTSNYGLGIYYENLTTSPNLSTPVIRIGKYITVIDAIIYNREELINASGISSSVSNEELIAILLLWDKDNEKTIPDFSVLATINGDFAGAVIDSSSNDIYLFRDHMGIRPLFYYKSDDIIAFSSDLRGLLSMPIVHADINTDWLYKIASGYNTYESFDTEIKDVHEVEISSYICVSANKDKLSYCTKKYWHLGSKIKYASFDDYANKLRELITDSVRRRLAVFPGTIGAELSGGLDSGVIDILINRLGRSAIYYSWSFSPKDLPLVPNDERQVIADICNQEGIECLYGNTTIDVSPESNLAKSHSLIGIPYNIDDAPELNFAFPAYVNTLIISETAQLMQNHGCKVVFSGHGGDEGVSHRCVPFELFYHHEYYHFIKCLWLRNKEESHRFYQTAKQIYHHIRHQKKYLKQEFRSKYHAKDILNDNILKAYADYTAPVLTFSFDSIRYIENGNTHNRPNVAALLGAYSGARYVFPYLDYNVINYAVSVPRHLYLNGKQNRYLFRQAFKDIMPKSLYEVTVKDNPSTANVNEDYSDWLNNVKKYNNELFNSIDWDYWRKYLNYESLSEWKDADVNDDKGYKHCVNVTVKLRKILQTQHMMKVVKEII